MTGSAAPDVGSRVRASLTATAIVAGIVVAIPATLLVGSQILLAGVAALACGLCALISPIFAAILLLVTLFLRLPLRSEALPVEVYLLVFAAMVVATALWMDRTPSRLRGTGAVEWAMALYLMWNVYSMFAPHKYPAIAPLYAADSFSVPRFIVVSTAIPFAMYVVGRYTFDRTAAVRVLLWAVLTLAAYSAAVSIMPFTGRSDLVWPRYIVNIDRPNWVGRAVGIFNQPVANGMVLAVGLAIAMLLLSRRDEPKWRRCVAFVIAVACGVGVYLTYTRAAWLSAMAVLIIGAILAKGYRRGFITVLCLVFTMIVINWSRFTSADRDAGGVASERELESRLNDIQTALWAFERKPIEGWGIGRFPAVNTYHHQQWSPDVVWSNGYGEIMHQTELGILAELGLIGLAAWICVLALVAYRLWNAYKTLPDHDLCGKPIAVIAIMAVVIQVGTGLTVDLRYFDFSTAVIFLLVGIAIGCSDRHKRALAAPGGYSAELVRPRHA